MHSFWLTLFRLTRDESDWEHFAQIARQRSEMLDDDDDDDEPKRNETVEDEVQLSLLN